MLIAIIDDGINSEAHPELRLFKDFVVESNGIVRQRYAQERVRTNHGTICAQIIHNYVPNALFCSIAIFQHAKVNANLQQLISALKLCLKLNADLIHMSIGTVRLSDYYPIRDIVAKILQNGQIIVAAQSNTQCRYTMPACFSGVFGVAADSTLYGCEFYLRKNTYPDNVQIYASSQHALPAYETQVSNSFAAPTITAKLFQFLESLSRPDFSSHTLFRQLANGDTQVSLARIRPDFLLHAIIYDPGLALSPELSDYYIFKTLKSVSDTDDFFRLLQDNPTIPALIATSSPSNSKVFFDKLFYCSKARAGIVYAGTLATRLKLESPCLIWDESACHFPPGNISRGLKQFNAPILMVNPFGVHAMKFICRLERLFIKSGYSAVTLTNYPRSYLFGFIYLAQGERFDEIIAHIQQTMEPDICICTVSGHTTGMEKIDIELSDVCNLQITSGRIVLPLFPSEIQIQELFNYLVTE